MSYLRQHSLPQDYVIFNHFMDILKTVTIIIDLEFIFVYDIKEGGFIIYE